MSSSRKTRLEGPVRQIECLACGEKRVPSQSPHAGTGECRSCGYVGWALSADIPKQTRRSIYNRAFVPAGRDLPASGGDPWARSLRAAAR